MLADPNLPIACVARHDAGVDNTPILIRRGVRGYFQLVDDVDPDAYNASYKITPAQIECMVVGSMFGWDVPGARLGPAEPDPRLEDWRDDERAYAAGDDA